MESLVHLYNKYCEFLDNYSDQRTGKWFMMDSPLPILIITLIYLHTVKVLIPKYMKNRKAFNIKNCLQLYNVWHFSVNLVFAYLLCTLTYFAGYSWTCAALDKCSTGKPLMVMIELK
jgi:hypothetical protein